MSLPKVTDDIVPIVLERISCGETITAIAKDMDFSVSAWNQYIQRNAPARVAYDAAKDRGCEAMLDECLAIVDARPESAVTRTADGVVTSERIDSGAVAWAKNRIETRLKLLATWRPEKYGAKAAETNVTVNVASQDAVQRIGQELRLLRREAAGDVL